MKELIICDDPATNWMSSVSYSSGRSTAYTWDAAGNMTGEGATSFQYDAASRLKTVNNGTTETNGFDGDSQRVKKVEGSVTVFYVRSSVMKQTAFEVGGNGALYRAYVNAGSVIAQLSVDGQFYWRHQNHLGSGYKLTNSTGTVVYRGEFDPYGQTLLETGSTTLNSHKFTGYEKDQSTGLDYAEARMSAGSRGRFTTPDPQWLSAASARRPQTLNRYSYVNNDPVNFVDRTGLGSCGFLICDSITVNGNADGDKDYLPGNEVNLDLPAEPGGGGGSGVLFDIVLALADGFVTAQQLLENPACAALFGQINSDPNLTPTEYLNLYFNNNLVQVGREYIPGGGQSPVSFRPGTGAVTSAQIGSYPRPTNPDVRISSPVIVINQNGFYFSGQVNGTNVSNISGSGFEQATSLSQVRALVLIHELLHAAGKLPHDNSADPNVPAGQSEANSRMIANACLPPS
jgi:RHS repeat-associated protein